jgi:hypothetical protein
MQKRLITGFARLEGFKQLFHFKCTAFFCLENSSPMNVGKMHMGRVAALNVLQPRLASMPLSCFYPWIRHGTRGFLAFHLLPVWKALFPSAFVMCKPWRWESCRLQVLPAARLHAFVSAVLLQSAAEKQTPYFPPEARGQYPHIDAKNCLSQRRSAASQKLLHTMWRSKGGLKFGLFHAYPVFWMGCFQSCKKFNFL